MVTEEEIKNLKEGQEIWAWNTYNEIWEKAAFKDYDSFYGYVCLRFFSRSEKSNVCLDRIKLDKMPKPLHDYHKHPTWDGIYFFFNYLNYSDSFSRSYPSEFELLPVADSEDMVSIYMNEKDKEKGKRTETKIGKALRKMFPFANDKKIAECVVEWKSVNTKADLTFYKDKCSFAEVYSKENMKESVFGYKDDLKPLSTSCMRGTGFYEDDTHPCEVFNSGDFWIYWVEDEIGDLGARCVVYENDKGELHGGPVYINTEQAKDMILGELTKDQVKRFHDGTSWKGAKILAIPFEYHGNHHYLAPYLDHGYAGKKSGEYFILGEGDAGFGGTEGWTYYYEKTCHLCGTDESYDWQTVEGEDVCSCCADKLPVCEHYLNSVLSEESLQEVTVGAGVTEMWGERAVRYCATPFKGSLVCLDFIKQKYRQSRSGEWFPRDEKFVYYEGSSDWDTDYGYYHISEVKDTWVKNSEGGYVYKRVEPFTTEETHIMFGEYQQ